MNDRLKKAADDTRASRASQTREVTEPREITEEERLDNFRSELYQESLPRLPPIPGYHVCWLTTESRVDTIQWRQSIGYELIRSDEIPGFEFATVKSGDRAGYVGVNEMLAAKIPERLYQKYMAIAHHEKPLAESGKITDKNRALKNEASNFASSIRLGDGSEALENEPTRPPVF